jgi:hypothetical protein
LQEFLPQRAVFTPKEDEGRRVVEFTAAGALGRVFNGLIVPNRGGGPNGIRTRVSALRGPCPGPLDDGAMPAGYRRARVARRKTRIASRPPAMVWLGEEDSNPRYVVQSHVSYH